MSARTRLREILARDACAPAAPIFDPLSARIAEAMGWEVCKLSGSVWKAATLAIPDDVPLADASDLFDVCRRITRVAPEMSLMVDADDAGGTTLTARRTVRELEDAGASAIEIEDTVVPQRFARAGAAASRHGQFIAKDTQLANLRSAVASRRDPATVIVARTSAISELPTDEALDRVRDYARTGVDAIMLPGFPPRGRADIEAVRSVSELPLCVLGLPADVVADTAFLAANRVRIRYLGQPVYQMAVRAIYESLKHLQDGGSAADLRDRVASADQLRTVDRRSELQEWERSHDIP